MHFLQEMPLLKFLNMKIKYYHRRNLFLFLGLSLFGCQQKNTDKNERIFEKFPQEKKVSLQNIFEFKKGKPGKLFIVDSTLIIYNFEGKKDSFLYNYSIKSGTLSSGYIKGGRGPGEGIGVFSTGITNDMLWMYDISLKKIMTFKTKELLRQQKTFSFVEHPVKSFYYQISLNDSTTFLAVGNPQSKKKIQEIDLKSEKIIAEYGEFKNVPNDVPFDAYKSSFQSFMLRKPSGNKTVLFYRYTDLIEIYDTKKHNAISTKGPEGFDPDLDVMKLENENISVRNKKTRFAFVNGTATDQYIYLLYSGNKEEDKYFDSAKNIYVYDWSGNPVKKIILNKYVTTIVVSKDNKTLYAYDPYSGYILQSKIQN